MHTHTRHSVRSRLSSLFAVLALVVAIGACGSDDDGDAADTGSSSGTDAAVVVEDFSFETSPVKAGETVTIENKGNQRHSVTADDDSFDVVVNAGETGEFTAPDTGGDVKIHCNFHAQMKGTLTVEE